MNEKKLPWKESLVILPTHNEAENIESLLRDSYRFYPGLSFLVIDDNSPDKTAQLVKKLQGEFASLHLIERECKLGLCSAYITGFRWALEREYRFVFEMDSDFSHDPCELSPLLEAAEGGADLAIGSRYIGGIRVMNWPFKRLLLSYLAGIYIRIVTCIPLSDPTGGFKCFSRKTLQALDFERILSKGYIFQFELNYKIWKMGFAMVEIPITFHQRRRGVSKMGGTIIAEAFFRVFQLRWRQLTGSLLSPRETNYKN